MTFEIRSVSIETGGFKPGPGARYKNIVLRKQRRKATFTLKVRLNKDIGKDNVKLSLVDSSTEHQVPGASLSGNGSATYRRKFKFSAFEPKGQFRVKIEDEDNVYPTKESKCDPKTKHALCVLVDDVLLEVASGSGQTAKTGSKFSKPLSVVVTDQNGSPVIGEDMTFKAPSGGASGTFDANGKYEIEVTTDKSGMANAGTFTANATAGSYKVTVESESQYSTVELDLENLSSASEQRAAK